MALTKTPIELSSTPGIVDNSNATAITIDSSENVGIGITDPDQALEIGAAGKLKLSRADNARSLQLFTDNSFGTIETSNDPIKIASAVYTRFDTAGTERMRIGSTGIIYVNGDGTGGRISGDGSGGLVLQDGNGRQSFKIMSPSSGSSQAMTLDASGNLFVGGKTGLSDAGVGHAFAGGANAGLTYHTTDGTIAMSLNRLTSDGSILRFVKDGTAVGSWRSRSGVVSTIILDPRTNGVGLSGTATAVIPTSNTGVLSNAAMDIGGNGYAFKDAYLSGGVVFGTTGGSVSSKTLDDYEEGTWNSVFTIPSGSVTYNTGTGGVYTKIGRMVHVNAWIYVNALSSPSGSLTLTLPFTNVGNARASQVNVVNRWTGVTGQIGCWLSNNSTSLNFVTLDNGTMGGSALNGTNMQTNCEIYLNFSYETS